MSSAAAGGDLIKYNLNVTIKYNQDHVDTYMNELFKQSAACLQHTYNTNDLADLNLMYINAIEDSLYANSIENNHNENTRYKKRDPVRSLIQNKFSNLQKD